MNWFKKKKTPVEDPAHALSKPLQYKTFVTVMIAHKNPVYGALITNVTEDTAREIQNYFESCTFQEGVPLVFDAIEKTGLPDAPTAINKRRIVLASYLMDCWIQVERFTRPLRCCEVDQNSESETDFPKDEYHQETKTNP